MSGGGSKGGSSTKVRIPRLLQPLVQQGAAIGGDTLGNLQGLLDQGNEFVAGFNPVQQLAQGIGINRALGDGGFFDTAQQTILDAAQGGGGIDNIIPQSIQDALTSAAGAPQNVLDRLQGLPEGVADRLASVSSGLPSFVTDTLVGGNQTANNALEATAGGDFLFGGDGFNAAVDAAVRAATPGILSTFGSAGVGAGTGGLAQAAIGQAGVDAFARQFAQERQNQLGAANSLNNQGTQRASVLGNLDLASSGLEADIGSQLAQLGVAGAGQNFNEASLLANLFQNQQGQNFQGNSLLAQLGLAERGNQLNAATQLPDIATSDLAVLDSIGGAQQNLSQQQLSAPIDAQLQLLQAALGGVPIESLLGSKTKGRSFNLGF